MVRFRIKYRKVGAVRYTSHRDVMRIFRRSFAAGGVPVCYSEGFNPHPRLSFGPSLRTGWEGLGEYMDALVEREIPDLHTRCNANLPEGLEVVEYAEVCGSVPKLSADVRAARYEIALDATSLGRSTGWIQFVEESGGRANRAGVEADRPLLDVLERGIRGRFAGARDGRRGGTEPALLEIEVYGQEGEIRIEYLSTMHQGKSLFPEDILEPFIGDPRSLETPMRVARKALYVERNGAFHLPISRGVVQKFI